MFSLQSIGLDASLIRDTSLSSCRSKSGLVHRLILEYSCLNENLDVNTLIERYSNVARMMETRNASHVLVKKLSEKDRKIISCMIRTWHFRNTSEVLPVEPACTMEDYVLPFLI